MAPPYPPLPIPLNLPFQPLRGSRTSKLMEESLVGLATPFTWQLARRVGVAAIATALVMVAFGRERVVRLSHDCAASVPVDVRVMTAKDAAMAMPPRRKPGNPFQCRILMYLSSEIAVAPLIVVFAIGLLRTDAPETCRIAGAAFAGPTRDLRIRAQRARQRPGRGAHDVGSQPQPGIRGPDRFRRDPLLHPSLERSEGVERIDPRPARAVRHAREHEEPDEVGRLALRLGPVPASAIVPAVVGEEIDHAVQVIDAVARVDRLVRPAVVHDELSAQGLEVSQIRVRRVDDRSQPGVAGRNVAIVIDLVEGPARVHEQEIAIEGQPDSARRGREDERPERLAAALDTRVEQLAGARTPQAGIVLPHRVHLCRGQAVWRVGAFA